MIEGKQAENKWEVGAFSAYWVKALNLHHGFNKDAYQKDSNAPNASITIFKKT